MGGCDKDVDVPKFVFVLREMSVWDTLKFFDWVEDELWKN